MAPLPSVTALSGGKGAVVMTGSRIGVIDELNDVLYDVLSDVAGAAESLLLVAGGEDGDHMRIQCA